MRTIVYGLAVLASPLLLGQTPDGSTPTLESLLQTKVVTASRFSEDIADAPGIMTVVTRAEIVRFGGLTLREILNRVSGLSIVSNTLTDRSVVSVRGEQSKDIGSHVLFLINGRPTREVLNGGIATELLEAFPVFALERIEVIEGPGSVLYGSNAYSGVINLITRKGDGKSSGVMRGFGTSNGPNGGSAEGAFTRGAFSFSGAAQFHQDTRWATPIWPDVGAGVVIPVQPFTMYDRSRGMFASAEYKGFSAMFSTMDRTAPFEIYDSFGQSHWQRTFADLGYDAKLGSHWDSGLHATYTGTTLDTSAFPVTSERGHELELHWTNSVTINERLRLTFGALYNFQAGGEIDALFGPAATSTDATRSSGAAYGQLEFRLTDGLNLIGGVQTNKVGGIPTHAVPRVGAMWSPASHWHVKALFGEAFRAPSLNEVNIQVYTVYGNLHLLPELSSTLDLAVTYQDRSRQSTFSFFRSHQSNTIVAMPNGSLSGGLLTFQYRNVAGLTFKGAQWDGKWYLSPRLLLEASALHQRNEDAQGHVATLPTPVFSGKAGLSFADKEGWTVGLFDVYTGAIEGFDTTNNPRPGPHHLVTANLRLNLEKYFGAAAKNVSLFAHGDNLLNRAVWLPAWGYTSASTLPFERGRTIYYGIEFSFKRE